MKRKLNPVFDLQIDNSLDNIHSIEDLKQQEERHGGEHEINVNQGHTATEMKIQVQ